MKKLTFLIILVLTSVLYYSCETDVTIIDDYEDITVVYGILNPLDDTTFIKVNNPIYISPLNYMITQNT